MLEKQEGKINEIVYEHTAHRGGKYRLYPTIEGLSSLLDDLTKANATTEYLRITPFYVNEKTNRQIEFGRFMFFLECRDSFTEEEEEEAIKVNYENGTFSSHMDWEKGKALYPLCRFDDPQKFGRSLGIYRGYLNKALPEMFSIAKDELKLQEVDFAFGFFCFEVHSE